MIPRVKVCGLRRAEDAALALELGASHLGCVLARESPRCASLDEARAIAACGGVTVLVFRRPTHAAVLEAVERTGVERVQVHAAERGLLERLESEGVRCHPVYSLSDHPPRRLPPLEPAPTAERPGILDVGRGGGGVAFDWTLLGGSAPRFTFVAGGVDPGNLPALLVHAPWGIDLSSGIESTPGVKDHERMRRLFAVLGEVGT